MAESRVPTKPGWYNDPEGRYSHQAYWDGEKWTGATRPPPRTISMSGRESGWYRVPGEPEPRYWDGFQWTDRELGPPDWLSKAATWPGRRGPEDRDSPLFYWDGEKWTLEDHLLFWRIKGANREAVASVSVAGVGSLLTIWGWSIQGSLFEGERTTALMIAIGTVLGMVAVILTLDSLAGKQRDARTKRARGYGLLLGLIAFSPAVCFLLLLGAALEGL